MIKKESPIDFETSFGPWIGKTVKLVDCYLFESFAKNNLDLSKEQMIVLKKLHDQNGLNQNELAYLTYRDKSSLARLLSKMELKGYVIKKQNQNDKRINEVFLTVNGRAIYSKALPIIKDTISIMESCVSIEEKDQLIKILKKVQQNFETKLNQRSN